MGYEPIARWKQALGGALIAVIGAGYTAWMWHDDLTREHFYFEASMLMPAFAVLGLGLVIFPGYKEERIARGEDISGISEFQLVTPRWWAIMVLCLVAGVGNHMLLR
jgi:hypothetical protein